METKEITVRFPEPTLQELDALASEEQVTRDSLLIGLVGAYLECRQVRRSVLKSAETKSQQAAWDRAFVYFDAFRQKFDQVDEAELDALLDEAVAAARATGAG